jgi:hypothetical protein
MHRVGAPFRYRTIALSGLTQLCGFLFFIQDLHDRGRPTPAVESLCVQCVRPQGGAYWRGPAATRFDTTGLVPNDARTRPSRRLSISMEWVVREHAETSRQHPMFVLPSLLDLVAPTLQFLALVMDRPPLLSLVPTTLPALTELTCRFVSPPSNDPPYESGSTLNRLPALLRLHLIGPTFAGRFRRARELPAGLTHLRYTSDRSPEHTLACLSTIGPTVHGEYRLDIWPPVGLERILISPDEWLEVTSFDTINPSDWCSAARTAVDITDRVSIVREPAPYDAQQVYEHWLQRNEGRKGCWVAGVPLVEFTESSDYGVF